MLHLRNVAAIIALSTAVLAQELTDLPDCATSCVGTNFGDCSPIDVACICANEDLITGLSCCVANGCSPEDQQATIDFAVNICRPQGVNLPTSASCPGGASATSASSSGTATSASGASVTNSPSSSATSTLEDAEETADSATSATSAAAEATAGASRLLEAGAGIGAVVAGAFMLL